MTAGHATDAFSPDATGHWGQYGGRFVPEALVAALDEEVRRRMQAALDELSVGRIPLLGRLREP